MIARASRRLSQPDCAPRAPSRTKNGVDAPLPLAQLHPRNALPRVPFAARIRKAGRILTAPLAQRHSRKSSEFRRIRVLPSANSQEQPKMASKTQKLIHGSAIKTPRKPF